MVEHRKRLCEVVLHTTAAELGNMEVELCMAVHEMLSMGAIAYHIVGK